MLLSTMINNFIYSVLCFVLIFKVGEVNFWVEGLINLDNFSFDSGY